MMSILLGKRDETRGAVGGGGDGIHGVLGGDGGGVVEFVKHRFGGDVGIVLVVVSSHDVVCFWLLLLLCVMGVTASLSLEKL